MSVFLRMDDISNDAIDDLIQIVRHEYLSRNATYSEIKKWVTRNSIQDTIIPKEST